MNSKFKSIDENFDWSKQIIIDKIAVGLGNIRTHIPLPFINATRGINRLQFSKKRIRPINE